MNVQNECEIQQTLKLPPTDNNPRNSEGDIITLEHGRLLFIYSHFYEGWEDHAGGYLAARFSEDNGKTWADKDARVIENYAGMNLMSVTLLSLSDNRIALFYVQKNSFKDCKPVMRISQDQARTWSNPVPVITDQMGYFVLNNDRVVRLSSGRLIAPVAKHEAEAEFREAGEIMCYVSDDEEEVWKCSNILFPEKSKQGTLVLQEPGVVELKNGRLMMFIRTNQGCQYLSYSEDRGETWSEPGPCDLKSPLSPASIKRIPSTGDLLAVWNNTSGALRTPFNSAVSKDEGKTWQNIKTLYDNPNGWYCYTAIEFIDNHILLAHCAGDTQKMSTGLSETWITRIPVEWVYK